MRFIYQYLLLLSFAGSLTAQTDDKKEIKVNCRLLSLERGSKPLAMVTPAADRTAIACSAPSTSLSDDIQCYARDGSISFLAASDRQPLASVKIPTDVRSVILVFVPGSKNDDAQTWKIFPIEDSKDNFPDGGAFVANFHHSDIRFIVGENKLQLRAAGSRGVAMPSKRDDFNMAPVAFQFSHEGKWRIASETMLRFLPGMRYLMFAYSEAVSGKPRITMIEDFRESHPVVIDPEKTNR